MRRLTRRVSLRALSSFVLLRFNASRPSTVFRSRTIGSNDSATNAKPPVPDALSFATAPERRNASTATMMNAAEAINVTHSTVRAGRYVVLRKPICDIAHHPGRRIVTAFLLLNHVERKQM